MRRTLCTLATVGLGLSLILGSAAVASATTASTVTAAQCTADGGTAGSKDVAPDGTPDLVPVCNGIPISG